MKKKTDLHTLEFLKNLHNNWSLKLKIKVPFCVNFNAVSTVSIAKVLSEWERKNERLFCSIVFISKIIE